MDATKTRELVETTWDETIVPTISDYIYIPNKSPMFDPDWEAEELFDAVETAVGDALDEIRGHFSECSG